MTKNTTDIIFEKKFTKSGEDYFQGIGQDENMFFVKCWQKSKTSRETWKLVIKKPWKTL